MSHSTQTLQLTKIALIVALGGFLMGFDASVISGVVKFIEIEFSLTKLQLGWAVASLSLTATVAMLVSGPLSDKFGRKPVLKVAAFLFLISAVASALAPDFITLVLARMIGGFGVGAALIIAPMYIAEVSPAKLRGRMVSLNQLNIVIGISVAFFSNYLILNLATSNVDWTKALGFEQWNWRWMLGIEAVPALLYLLGLKIVPESPRWLISQNRINEAEFILESLNSPEIARNEVSHIKASLQSPETEQFKTLKEKAGALLQPRLRLVMLVGISVAILQQITGINAVFFYAPMIFEQSGIGTDAAFLQAISVGITNLIFTLVAIWLIDKIGRKKLLLIGVIGIACSMLSLSHGFYTAKYQITPEHYEALSEDIKSNTVMQLTGKTFNNDVEFKEALKSATNESTYLKHGSEILTASTHINQNQILFSILAFVACFAFSLGPVMWVLFSELFPNYIRGLAISFVGLINSAISFSVQLVFPWELETLGSGATFLIYGAFAVIGTVIIAIWVPETKGKSLEELEEMLTTK